MLHLANTLKKIIGTANKNMLVLSDKIVTFQVVLWFFFLNSIQFQFTIFQCLKKKKKYKILQPQSNKEKLQGIIIFTELC